MANYANLDAAIQAAIYENATNDITGTALQTVLLQMVTDLGKAGMLCNGVADGATVPPVSPDSNIFYIASTGTYANFGGLTVAEGEWAIFIYNGSWQKQTVQILSVSNGSETGKVLATLTVGSTTYQIHAEQTDATPTNGSSHPVQSGGVYTALDNLSNVAEKSAKLSVMIENLGDIAIRLSGQDAGNAIYPQSNIVLSSDGDSIEITFGRIDANSFSNGGYTFTKGISPEVRGIFVTNSQYRVRADDGTWLLSARTFASGKTLKVSYENGNILFYIDGVLDYTYTGQKTITIQSFGNGVVSSYLYWNGIIEGMKVNGSAVDIYTYFTFGNSASLYRTNSFLTDAQAAQIEAGFPAMFAEKTATTMYVYRKLRGNYYIKYPLVYRYKAYTADEYPSFYDNWGINPLALCRYESGSMTQVAQLFATGESELAIRVEDPNNNMAYVGGAAHGFDNIISVGGVRQIIFLVDDLAVAEDGVFALKEVSEIRVTQLSELCQAYTNSNPWAEATKEWHWDKDGFAITTSVKVLRSLQISQAQFGMFCVYRHWLGVVSNNYLTNKGIKNSDPYKIYTLEDGWESDPSTYEYRKLTHDCTMITEYGERGLGFAMEITDSTTKANGGMKVGTNNSPYNKIYFDLTGSYLPSVNEILKATQEWHISGTPIL